MPRKARIVIPGQPHHVVQRGVRGMNVFQSDADRLYYIQLCRDGAEKTGVHFLAWCLMSNHIHLLVVPEHQASLGTFFREVHGKYTRYFNKKSKAKGYLWEDRYYSVLVGGSHFANALRYILYNPVQAGLVAKSTEYRWSSAKFNMGMAGKDYLVLERPTEALLNKLHKLSYLGMQEDAQSIERALRNQWAYASDKEIKHFERITDTILQPQQKQHQNYPAWSMGA
ncbi:MAG: transposase [Verrucomicrobiota bacterium]